MKRTRLMFPGGRWHGRGQESRLEAAHVVARLDALKLVGDYVVRHGGDFVFELGEVAEGAAEEEFAA